MEPRFKEFEEVQRAHGALATRALGIVHVPIAEIVGSVGRARYFPLGLRPGRGLTPSRVRGLITALNRGVILPAVLLYRIGHEYFIADGHHRIAAARLAGQEYVDAEVVVFLARTRRPRDVIAWERVLFEQQTRLTNIVLHEVGQYPKLLRWIEDFRYEEGSRSIKSAARTWYGRVYLPTAQHPIFQRLLKSFVGWSPADVFVFAGDHKWIMSQSAGHDVGIPAALEDFERHLARRRGARGFLRWLESLVVIVEETR